MVVVVEQKQGHTGGPNQEVQSPAESVTQLESGLLEKQIMARNTGRAQKAQH